MGVAYCYSQCVGGIVGFWYLVETKNIFNHLLYLLFFCPAVAYNTLFYLKRRIFKNRNIVIFSRQNKYSSRLAYIYDGFGVVIIEKFFHRHFVRLIFFDNIGEVIVYHLES